MSEDDTERAPFLSRWSRRKVAAREGKLLPEPPVQDAGTVPDQRAPEETSARPTSAGASAGGAPAAAPSELPPVESLKGLASEYEAFMRPDVDDATRSAALRKLFGDPHFNVMDGLDVYIDDYGKPDPIPAAMLKTLHHARSLLNFPDEEAKTAAGDTVPAGTAEAPSAPGVDGATQQAPEGREANPDTAMPVPDGQNSPDTTVVCDLTKLPESQEREG